MTATVQGTITKGISSWKGNGSRVYDCDVCGSESMTSTDWRCSDNGSAVPPPFCYSQYTNNVLFLLREENRQESEWVEAVKERWWWGEKGVNELGIKDERGELKAALFVFSFTFLSFLWTSFLNKLRLETGRTNYRTTTACRDFRWVPSEKCKQITLECVY